MSAPLSPEAFAEFFEAVYGRDKNGRPTRPFPWQARLARRVFAANAGDPQPWRRYLALPTAAGKTACLDIAVFALALQASRPPAERWAPRRIFFVVDRRIVVDQTFSHARRLASKLSQPDADILRSVAGALQEIGADAPRPLDAYELRGGVFRENAWVRSPLQPTIITSTVDQIGSRLLFRGYGVSDGSQPIHAALIAHDALIILDEAHTAKPFAQTLELICKYRNWADSPAPRLPPLWFTQLTATPPPQAPAHEIEAIQEGDLRDPVLGPRLTRAKPAEITSVPKSSGLTTRLLTRTKEFADAGARSIALIVNRVATARDLSRALQAQLGDTATVITMTGRMRPLDREAAEKDLSRALGAPGPRCLIVVATQCLEVGADLDFEALVTECASLDALRQRFGRLNRYGARDDSPAAILAAADALGSPDPIYGGALAATWRWLGARADAKGPATRVVNFGVTAMDAEWAATDETERRQITAPAPDAATLLPAHLDLLSQTSPRPALDPDPAQFLHGPENAGPDVQLVFRGDLGEDTARWGEIVALCPPSSPEALPVRLRDFRAWLEGSQPDAPDSDLEATGPEHEPREPLNAAQPARRALRWRGASSENTAIVAAGDQLRPGDTFILPAAAKDATALGDFYPAGAPDDQAEQAFLRSHDRSLLRITPTLIPPLAAEARALSANDEDLQAKIGELLETLKTQAEGDRPRARAIGDLLNHGRHLEWHPLGGVVLTGRRKLGQFREAGAPHPAESWAAPPAPYPLQAHCTDVSELAAKSARHAGLPDLAAALETSGLLHDAGKADPRFQAWLRGGSAAWAGVAPLPVAKATTPMPTRAGRERARRLSGYPRGGRHELHSVRLAATGGAIPPELDAETRDLILHLVATHHGYCRPFAPVIRDEAPLAFEFAPAKLRFIPEPGVPSSHGLEHAGSGVADRFWRLTRRYGWWGLAYIETLLRLADWNCDKPSGGDEI